jgi:hypothetical protein
VGLSWHLCRFLFPHFIPNHLLCAVIAQNITFLYVTGLEIHTYILTHIYSFVSLLCKSAKRTKKKKYTFILQYISTFTCTFFRNQSNPKGLFSWEIAEELFLFFSFFLIFFLRDRILLPCQAWPWTPELALPFCLSLSKEMGTGVLQCAWLSIVFLVSNRFVQVLSGNVFMSLHFCKTFLMNIRLLLMFFFLLSV